MSTVNPEVADMQQKGETKRALLSIEDILKAEDTAYATVPAWGSYVRLGSLDAGTMLDFIERNDGPGKKTAGIRILIQSLVDENGNRIGKPEMIEAFKKKNAKVINELVDHIMVLNGLGTTRVDLSGPLASAGEDPEKLAGLVAELRSLADRVEAAGVDKGKLKAILDDPGGSAKARREAKNDSSEAR